MISATPVGREKTGGEGRWTGGLWVSCRLTVRFRLLQQGGWGGGHHQHMALQHPDDRRTMKEEPGMDSSGVDTDCGFA